MKKIIVLAMLFGSLMRANDDPGDLQSQLEKALDGQRYSEWEGRPSMELPRMYGLALGPVAGAVALCLLGILRPGIKSPGNEIAELVDNMRRMKDNQLIAVVVGILGGFIGYTAIGGRIHERFTGSARRKELCSNAAEHYRDVINGRTLLNKELDREASAMFEEIERLEKMQNAVFLQQRN